MSVAAKGNGSMARYGRKRKAGRGYLLLVAAVLIVGLIVGASGKTSASSEHDASAESNGFFDRAKRFVGNVINGFWGDKDTVSVTVDITAGTGNYMMLINANNPLERDYKPEEMVDIAQHVSATKSSIYLETQASESYIKMVNAMKNDGIIGFAAVSGYRDYDYQTRLHNAEIERQRQHYSESEARRRAARIVAAPGTSEHQSGLAIDVSSADIGYILSSKFENTSSFAWLKVHGHEYGFIIRYEQDKTDITGVIYEPWHLRYVGEMATDIYESGLCFEEYLEVN